MFRFGIVGSGNIGGSHSGAISQNGDCCLTAVADVVSERAQSLAKGHGARVYTDYREMCAKEDLDAVIINLSHFLHCESTVFFWRTAFRAGRKADGVKCGGVRQDG